MAKTSIEWTEETLNIFTGCTKVSPGCDNCYMFTQYPRLKSLKSRGYETSPDDVRFHPDRLERPLRWKRKRMVFVNSMSDTFHPHISFETLDSVFDVLFEASEKGGHTFQVLTKRPGRAAAWWGKYSAARSIDRWPEGVWMGTSVESQKYAPRLAVLERIPAPVRFVSAEPLLSRLSLAEYLERGAVQWVIVGGESGPNARPMDIDWARQLRDECGEHDVAFFLKQLGGNPNKRGGDQALLEGETYHEMPTTLAA